MWRPVQARAILSASITASVPDDVKRTLSAEGIRLVACSEMAAQLELPTDCFDNRLKAVAQQQRSVTHPVVYELIAGDIPFERSRGSMYCDGKGVNRAAVVCNSARDYFESAII